jgi:uncharacterized protein YbaP (TraB family)
MAGRPARWIGLGVLLAAGWVRAAPVEAAARPFLWKLESPASTAYLFGSLHVGRADLYPLPEQVTAAFEGCTRLVVEANTIGMDEAALARTMMVKALRLDGPGYASILDEELYRRMTRVARRHGLTPTSLDRLKPWYAAQLLALLEMKRLGIDPAHGMDRHFIRCAGDDLPILELEGLDRQLAFLESLSEEEQRLMLAYTLRDLENLEANMNAITAAWKGGDAARLDALLHGYLAESPGLEAVFERLFSERDREMTERLIELLGEGGRFFVVVGAGHLVTRDGIIQRLKRAGFEVRQIE